MSSQSKLEQLTGKNYLSFSSMNSWLDCGERFRLERVMQVEQTPSWWLVGGKAFHTATELLDNGLAADPADAWRQAWERELADTGGDPAKFRAGGRVSKEWPNKENADWWNAHGPRMVADYLAFMDGLLKEGWSYYFLPDGKPAVELAVQLDLSDVLVKGYVDRLMVNPDGELEVWDLKTGSHRPASTLQLGVYGLGVERNLGVRPLIGRYYMARKVELGPPLSLYHYTDDLVGEWFAHALTAIELEVFIPHVTALCGTCSVAAHCTAMGALAPRASSE